MLHFTAQTHVYTWNGHPVPSVTQLLRPLQDWGMVPRDVMEASKERGTHVHKITQLYDEKRLDPESVDPEYQPYLDAWCLFLRDYGAVWDGIEVMGYSTRCGFAGTYDRRGALRTLRPGNHWIVDIKTSAMRHPIMGVQLAAYRQIETERDPLMALARRATVQLLPSGTYQFYEWTSSEDWNVFQSLITLSNWANKS